MDGVGDQSVDLAAALGSTPKVERSIITVPCHAPPRVINRYIDNEEENFQTLLFNLDGYRQDQKLIQHALDW